MAKAVLITGAATGIGRETARRFAAEGWCVAVHYNSSEAAAQKLVEELKARHASAVPVRADIRDGAAVEAMMDKVRYAFGRVDALVCNAGISQQKLFTDLTPRDWNDMFDVNVTGAYRCIQAVLPGMISRKQGSIVTVSSIWGVVGASCEVHYSASKAALIGLTKALAKELGPSGIRVNCVAPGVIDTAMNAHLDDDTKAALKDETPLQTIGTPRDVAEAILYLASDKSNFVTGQVLGVNGGMVV